MAVTDVYKAKRSRRVKRLRIRGVEYAINEWGNSADPLFIYLLRCIFTACNTKFGGSYFGAGFTHFLLDLKLDSNAKTLISESSTGIGQRWAVN